MSLSSRDKKILTLLIPVAVLLGFWFVLLAPKRSEAARQSEQLAAAEQKRDTAVSAAGQLEGARATYAKDYETVVRLGKAVPSSVDVPSLLVQLDSAAKGTKIDLDGVKAGARTTAPAPAPAAGPASGGSGSSSPQQPPAAAGGASAQTGPGKATEKAGNARASADQSSAASDSTPPDSTPPAGAPAGSPAPGATGAPAPSGGSTAPSGAAAGGSGAPGLESAPLEFTFTGSFFDLADFFHEMKRFVRVANGKVKVKGRLMTVDSLDFKSEKFPTITASVKATVYLSPKSEGATAGATPSGPQPAPASAAPASGAPAPSGSGAPAANPPAGGAQ